MYQHTSRDRLWHSVPLFGHDWWLCGQFIQLFDNWLLLSVSGLQFGKHHGLSFFELLSDFIDVLSLHVSFGNPLSVHIGCRLVIILLSHLPRVFGSLSHMIKIFSIFLLVLGVFEFIELYSLSDFILLFFNLLSLLVVVLDYGRFIVVDVRFYHDSMLVYSHAVRHLLLHHLFVMLLLLKNFLLFHVVHFSEEIGSFFGVSDPFLGAFLFFLKFD